MVGTWEQVSLSTFLVIGATSSLTYNVVGHIKTVIILMGGCMFFGDEMPLKKLAGISVAMLGIIWYSQVGPPLPHTASPLVCLEIRDMILALRTQPIARFHGGHDNHSVRRVLML